MTEKHTLLASGAVMIHGALLAALLVLPAPAQEDDDPSIAQSCLVNSEIRRTTILGNRNIVFITRDDEIYNNQLPRQCPSLRRRSLVNYPVVSNRLCAGYRFAVLMEHRPGDYIATSICELGAFVPISEQELADLTVLTAEDRGRRERRRASARGAMTTRPVELPPEETAAEPAKPTEPAATLERE
jgi:hypothetical protein